MFDFFRLEHGHLFDGVTDKKGGEREEERAFYDGGRHAEKRGSCFEEDVVGQFVFVAVVACGDIFGALGVKEFVTETAFYSSGLYGFGAEWARFGFCGQRFHFLFISAILGWVLYRCLFVGAEVQICLFGQEFVEVFAGFFVVGFDLEDAAILGDCLVDLPPLSEKKSEYEVNLGIIRPELYHFSKLLVGLVEFAVLVERQTEVKAQLYVVGVEAHGAVKMRDGFVGLTEL